MRLQVLEDTGHAPTIHQAVQTEGSNGMEEIVFVGKLSSICRFGCDQPSLPYHQYKEFFNKLLKANQYMQKLLTAAPEEGRRMLEDKLTKKWTHLQASTSKRLAEIEMEKDRRVRGA